MISATELRIGNYVNMRLIGLETESTPMMCNAHCLIDIAGENGAFLNKKCYDPIPITPEILIAAGFEKFEPSGEYYSGTKGLSWFRGHGLVGYCSYGPDAPYGGFSFDNFKNPILNKKVELAYVHQLQNLYFSLTGKELSITL